MNIITRHLILLFLLLCSFQTDLCADPKTHLKDNLRSAKPGDYIVTAQSKSFTVLHIYEKNGDTLTVEEISAPSVKLRLPTGSWKEWVLNGAPQHTSWVRYDIDLPTGIVKRFCTFSRNGWFETGQGDNFMSTLLNLRLEPIPLKERKRVGPPPSDGTPEWRSYWQPKMIFEGHEIKNVTFNALRTRWPKDGSDLSGKTIEIYIPEENDKYPSYFPYWLQINGMVGKAKIRIIDSGSNLRDCATLK